MTAIHRNRRHGRGQSLVEFALILPLFVLMVMAVIDLGRGVFAFNEISNAAREGVRTAIVNQNDTDIRARAAEQAISLGIPSTPVTCPTPGQPTTDTSGICITYVDPNGVSCSSPVAVGCQAIVSVKVTYTAITPIISNIVGIIPITASSQQSVEAACTGSGCPVP